LFSYIPSEPKKPSVSGPFGLIRVPLHPLASFGDRFGVW